MGRTSHENGQAAVETALVVPMMVFALLGTIQLAMTYHARMVTEYAAFKAARAASVYRLDCNRIRAATLVALVPTMPAPNGGGATQLSSRYVATVRSAKRNRTRASTPLVLVDYRLENRKPEGQFDKQLQGGENPMTVSVKVAYFYEYRIPFANWIMTRYWLATSTAFRWASGNDPTMPAARVNTPRASSSIDSEYLNLARRAIQAGYYTSPVVASWTMRMMSDPLPNAANQNRCR